MAYHIYGDATPIILDMVSTGAIIIEIDQKSDQLACKKAAYVQVSLLGPIDPSEVLAHGTPNLVIEKNFRSHEQFGSQWRIYFRARLRAACKNT